MLYHVSEFPPFSWLNPSPSICTTCLSIHLLTDNELFLAFVTMNSTATENVYSSISVPTSQKPRLRAQEQSDSLKQGICYFERLCSMLLPKPACEGCLGHLVTFWSWFDSDFPPLASNLLCQHWGEMERAEMSPDPGFSFSWFPWVCTCDWRPLSLISQSLCGGPHLLSAGGCMGEVAPIIPAVPNNRSPSPFPFRTNQFPQKLHLLD